MEPVANPARQQYFEDVGRRIRNYAELENKIDLLDIGDPLFFNSEGMDALQRLRTRFLRRHTICRIANCVYKLDHQENEFFENKNKIMEMTYVLEEKMWKECEGIREDYNHRRERLERGLLFGIVLFHSIEVNGSTSFVFRRLQVQTQAWMDPLEQEAVLEPEIQNP